MNRILTSHAGSLIRPPEVVSYINAISSGQAIDEAAYAECLRSSSTTSCATRSRSAST